MNKEYKIRNEEVGRSRKMTEALSIAPDKSGQAVDFSQRTGDANSSGLQPHILKMWLKPIFLFIINRWLKPTAKDRAILKLAANSFTSEVSGAKDRDQMQISCQYQASIIQYQVSSIKYLRPTGLSWRAASSIEFSTVSICAAPSKVAAKYPDFQAIRACLSICFLTISLIQKGRVITRVFQKRLPTAAAISAAGWKGFSPLFCENENDIMNLKTICQ